MLCDDGSSSSRRRSHDAGVSNSSIVVAKRRKCWNVAGGSLFSSCKYDAAAYLSVLALCSMVVKINCKRRKLRLHFYSILPSDYIHSACYTTQENGIID